MYTYIDNTVISRKINNNNLLMGLYNWNNRAQVVGWPPVRSFRKNVIAAAGQKGGTEEAAFVKVSMDGAPYLRKVDLKMYGCYRSLSNALGNMFSSFSTIGDFSLSRSLDSWKLVA